MNLKILQINTVCKSSLIVTLTTLDIYLPYDVAFP